jgi:predicted GNAT superfamily acetyltransferase
MSTTVKIRQLNSLADQKLGRAVFDQTWAPDTGSEITPNLLQAMVHCGAYLSGAFIKEKCVGAAFAFPAYTGELHLHSHMTAVLSEYRDQGVGAALKNDQWYWAAKNNYQKITWTFDPLVARNAKLNLIKLGVEISGYYPNFYGQMSDVLNAGDESDRLMVSWSTAIDAPKARDLISHPKPEDILIEIPEDIVSIRSRNQSESMKWRRQVRKQFMAAFEKNGKVIGFSTNNEYVVRI